MKAAVQEPPGAAGIDLANWYWKVVRQFVEERFSIVLSRSSCLNWLHRLEFTFKRPKKRLLKADAKKREAFVAEYAALTEGAQGTGARIFFADEAHFRADAEMRGKWVLKGEPHWWTRPARDTERRPAIIRRCAWRLAKWSGWNWRATATPGPRRPFLAQLCQRHPGPLRVIWDNAPAHSGEAVREYLRRRLAICAWEARTR